MLDAKSHQIENPERVLIGLIEAALKTKAKDKTYGTFNLSIKFVEGWPEVWKITDETTHKIDRPE